LAISLTERVDRNTGNAHKWSEVHEASYRTLDNALRVTLDFTVPIIDTDVEVLEVVSFKFWNQTSDQELCRMKYAGLRYVLVNQTNNCYMNVDTDWINYSTLEGHPCLVDKQDQPRSIELHDLKQPFHAEICKTNFTPDTTDIQVKRLNGFMRVYCFGHQITLKRRNETCPQFVFELPMTESFELNGHMHQASFKEKVLVNPHELHVNREIIKQLDVDRIRFATTNLTILDQSVQMFSKAANRAVHGVSSLWRESGLLDRMVL
jgi:hypothetical protein